jgi:hypothetical protein
MTDPVESPPNGRALEPVVTDWRSAPQEVWARVRDDYLAGLSAPACARRHGVGVSTLRERAARDGWRRADQPWPEPVVLDPDDEGRALEAAIDGDLNQLNPQDLAKVAESRMVRAVLRGDATAALRWRRVRDALDLDQAELDQWLAEDAAYGLAVRSRADDPDGLDGSDGVFRDAPA